MKKLQLAYEFAFQKHKNQTRNISHIPYVTHPVQVVHLLSHVVGIKDEDILCGAVLHDVIEDCDCTFEEIESKFNTKIASIVQNLSRPEKNGKSFKDKYEYLKEFSIKNIHNIEELIIKIVDRYVNVMDYRLLKTDEYFAKYTYQAVPVFNAFKESSHNVYDIFGKGVLDQMYILMENMLSMSEHSMMGSLIPSNEEIERILFDQYK